MKNVWKRTMCLLLSGILLLGNVPVQALATEEFVEEVVEEVVLEEETKTTQPKEIKPAAEVKAKDSVKNAGDEKKSGENPLIDYPVIVNGKNVTSANKSDVLGDGTVSYDGNGTLTLKDATITAENECAVDAYGALTIVLEGTNKLTATAGNKAAILVNGSLTIKGEGTLEAVSEKATAIHVFGSKDDKGNKSGLTVSGDVTIYAETKNMESSIGIESPNGVVIGDGNIHLKTNMAHSYEDSDGNPKGVYTLPAGYVKVGDADFETTTGFCMAERVAFEFVSENHVSETYSQTEMEHYRTCTCSLSENVKLQTEKHKDVIPANCRNGAVCGVCGEFGNKDSNSHAGSETKYRIDEEQGTHVLVYACCNAVYRDSMEEPHEYDYVISEDKTSMTPVCTVCDHEGSETIAITAPEGAVDGEVEWDNEEQAVTVNDPGAQIMYFKDSVPENQTGGEAVAPTAPGSYIAVVKITINGQTKELRMAFAIKEKALTEDMVALSSDSAVYDDSPKALPDVTVTDGDLLTKDTDYEVAYNRDGEAVTEAGRTNAGVITVTVTGKGNYGGTVNKAFTIEQADAAAELFVYTSPAELTYDAAAKTATLEPINTVQGMGETELRYYKDGAAEPAQPIDAGDYEVRIYVKGTGNYKEAEIAGTDWIFTIVQSDAYTAEAEENQKVGDVVGPFHPPVFKGLSGETVEGTCLYSFTYNDEQLEGVKEEEIPGYLETLADGSQLTISYAFTPAEDSNYTGNKTGTIGVTKVNLIFTWDGEAYTAAQMAEKVKKQGTITYGDENIVDVSKLAAAVNNETGEAGVGFTVRYSGTSSADEKTEDPAIGSNTFYVTYSGKLGEYEFTDVMVCTGSIYVNAKTSDATKVTVPVRKVLAEPKGGFQSPQALITAGKDENIGEVDLEYSLDGVTFSTEIPKASKPAAYKIWYRSPLNAYYTENSKVEGTVISVIKPYLTATYGDTLKAVVLPEGGEWTWQTNGKKLEEMSVGNVGVNSTYKLDYRSKTDSSITWSGNVDIHVAAKPINVQIELNEADKYMRYNNGNAVKARVTVTDLANNQALKENTDYTLEYADETKRGYAKVTVKPKGNITFTAGDPLTYVIYDVKALTLTDTSRFEGSGVEDKTGKDVKEALDDKLGTGYSDTIRKYTYFAMKMGDNEYSFEEGYWPEDGLGLAINYPTDATKMNGEYKVYAMYLSGEKAGEIIELKEAGTTLGMNQYKKGAASISVKMDGYMALCIAEKEEDTATTAKTEYKVSTTSSSYGTVKFTVGSSTTKKTSGNVKVGETITIVATPNTNYAVTKVQYTYKDGSTTKLVTLKQNDDGEYTLKMPAKDITLRATFAKKTSSSKNPYSGDTSNIYLWITVLAASAAAIVAVMIFWYKKRKK